MTEKIKIQEVVVVEGKDDTANLRHFYDVDTYETRGSAINDDDLERIDKLNDLRGVIVFTDPDSSENSAFFAHQKTPAHQRRNH